MAINYIQLTAWIIISMIFVIVIWLLLRYIDEGNDTSREEWY